MAEELIALDAQIVKESVRERDRNGYLKLRTSNLTRDQVAPYYGYEIPDWKSRGLEESRIYYGWRHPKELEKALHTFNGVPLLIEHKFDSASAPRKDLRVGTVGTSAKWEAPFLTNSLSVWDDEAIEAIEEGRLRDLSCGYRYEPDFTSGVTPDGLSYDFVMRNIACNHVALVNVGRAPDCYVADEKPKGITMSEEKKVDSACDEQDPEKKDEDTSKKDTEGAKDEDETKKEESKQKDEGAQDEAPEGEENKEEEKKDEGAMDAALIAENVRKSLSAQYQAAEAVRSVLGNVNALAYDSADAIYLDALKQMGVKDTPASAAKYVFNALQSVKPKTEAKGAMDAAPTGGEDFLKKFIR